MEEAVQYGGDGMKIRAEYAPLSVERRLGLYVDASHAFEDIFELSDRSEDTLHSLSVDGRSLERELSIETESIESDPDTIIMGNFKTGQIDVRTRNMPRSTSLSAVVRHHVYRQGPKEEEYILAVQRSLPNTKHYFFAVYEFELYANGVVHASLEANDVTLDGGKEGSTLSRSMNEYDMECFGKDIDEIIGFMQASRDEQSAARFIESSGA